MASRFDYVVIGSGIGGLLVAALLARQGFRVSLLERHSQPGGYGQSFSKQGYTFCAELHYLWNCGPGDEFGKLLRFLGLDAEIGFVRLDPDGFDRLRFPSFQYDIVNGFDRNIRLLVSRFPDHELAIRCYFALISQIDRELYSLPLAFSLATLLMHPLKFQHVCRFRNSTTEQLFDRLRFPLPLRSILAGQSGDLGLPPSQASLLAQAAVTCGYNAGAYVPEQSYAHMFDCLVDFIRRQDGCEVKFNRWVTTLKVQSGRVELARTRKGEEYRAGRFIYNGDPKVLPKLIPAALPSRFVRRLDYPYSASSFTLYLGVRGLDLREHGFGNWNFWHYQHDDINQCYAEQLDRCEMDDPMLFMTTPTLHNQSAPIAPENCQQLVICTPCSYEYFVTLRRRGLSQYQTQKQRVTERILDQVERHYVPQLRRHLDLIVAGSPVTNERFVLAPHGNAYGANLTPQHVNVGKVDYRTPLANLWLVGATAGAPSFAGGTHFAIRLVERLTGEPVLVDCAAPRQYTSDTA